jgi:hypothetical protein
MSPFVPSGRQARWKTIYDLLTTKQVGELLSYVEMAEVLRLNPVKERSVIQLAMRRAAREFEVVNKHAVSVVVNEGYRIVEYQEHLKLAQQHQRKSGKALARGQSKVVNVDFQQIDTETRKAFEIFAAAFAAQADFMRRMDVRQANLEQAVLAVTQRTEEQLQRTDGEINQLQERLRKLEQTLRH